MAALIALPMMGGAARQISRKKRGNPADGQQPAGPLLVNF